MLKHRFSPLRFLPDDIKRYFVNKDDWSIMEVEVKIYKISWLNENGQEFLQEMATRGTQKMF